MLIQLMALRHHSYAAISHMDHYVRHRTCPSGQSAVTLDKTLSLEALIRGMDDIRVTERGLRESFHHAEAMWWQ